MSIISQISTTNDFSHSEKIIADYILEHEWETLLLSAGDLSRIVYCSPATIVRFCKRIGYKGFNELKAALSQELLSMLETNERINWNFPFRENDSPEKIASSLAQISTESLSETVKMLDYNCIRKAADLLDQCSHIHMFGISQNYILAMDFQYKMMRIGKQVLICNASGDDRMWAYNVRKDECAILLSYTGETTTIAHVARILHDREIPTISITAMGNNTVKSLTRYNFPVVSYEKAFSKIAPFASEISFQFILNVLFSCVFSKNYAQNYAYKHERDVAIERVKNIREPFLLDETDAPENCR